VVNNKKKWSVMNPIWRQMKKHSPSSGQNDQLVHWWLLIHFGRVIPTFENIYTFAIFATNDQIFI
jgi:hypothetical protein